MLNIFGVIATKEEAGHIFDNLNETNDDRLPFKIFHNHCENIGIKLSKNDIRKVYDEICKYGNEKNNITRKALLNGFDKCNKNKNMKLIYNKMINGGQYDPQKGRKEINIKDIAKTIKNTKADWKLRIKNMESFSRQLTNNKFDSKQFHELMRDKGI